MRNCTKTERVRLRHLGYLRLLIVETLLIAFLPLSFFASWILSLALIMLSYVVMTCLVRYTLLRDPGNRVFYWIGACAILIELVWRLSFLISDPLGRVLSPIHLIVWIGFIGLTLYRLIRVLHKEPSVSIRVVMGAVAGYLLIGIGGGILLNSVWVLHPYAFDTSVMEPANHAVLSNRYASTLMASSFAMLSTVGSNIFTVDLFGKVSGVAISLVGQLYIVILIGLILGRYRPRNSL